MLKRRVGKNEDGVNPLLNKVPGINLPSIASKPLAWVTFTEIPNTRTSQPDTL
jgi:hypothetical protein